MAPPPRHRLPWYTSTEPAGITVGSEGSARSSRRGAWSRLAALWIVGPFLFFSAQFASTGRYYLPLVPALALVAAASLAGRRRVLTVVILLTAVWALAFTAIYRRPHTRVEASRWLHAHVPAGATIASEHWDDALPLSVDGRARDRYRSVELTLYDEENEDKRRRLVDALDAADWIVISSNRLYRSIPRAPWRYPLARRYYELLFGGQLGFRLEQVFTSYPRLGPLEIPDDEAEEQFTVLDHPKVLVFRKTDDFARARVEALFDAVSLADLVRVPPGEASALYWRMRPTEVPLPGAAGLRTAVAPRPMSSLGALGTSILALGAAESMQRPNLFLKAFTKILHSVYLKHYFSLRPGGVEEYEHWLPVVAGARLSENIPELEQWLVKKTASI